MTANVLAINDLNFEAEVLACDQPVLLYFGAAWCGPCRALGPIIEHVAGEHAGELRVAKVDLDSSPATVARLGVRAVPTLVVFRAGKVVARRVGAATREAVLTLAGAGAS